VETTTGELDDFTPRVVRRVVDSISTWTRCSLLDAKGSPPSHGARPMREP
jgi:hypothetical protein